MNPVSYWRMRTRWRMSRRGNLCRGGLNGEILTVFRRGGGWGWSISGAGGECRFSPEVYRTRKEAKATVWAEVTREGA